MAPEHQQISGIGARSRAAGPAITPVLDTPVNDRAGWSSQLRVARPPEPHKELFADAAWLGNQPHADHDFKDARDLRLLTFSRHRPHFLLHSIPRVEVKAARVSTTASQVTLVQSRNSIPRTELSSGKGHSELRLPRPGVVVRIAVRQGAYRVSSATVSSRLEVHPNALREARGSGHLVVEARGPAPRTRGRAPKWLEESLARYSGPARPRGIARPPGMTTPPQQPPQRRELPTWARAAVRQQLGPQYLTKIAFPPSRPAEPKGLGLAPIDPEERAPQRNPQRTATAPAGISAGVYLLRAMLDNLDRLSLRHIPWISLGSSVSTGKQGPLVSEKSPLRDGDGQHQPDQEQGRQRSERSEKVEKVGEDPTPPKAPARFTGDAESLRLLLLEASTLRGTQLSEFGHRHGAGSIHALLKRAHGLEELGDLDEEQALTSLLLILKLGGDFTYAHSARVLEMAMALADEMKLPVQQRLEILHGCLLKDIGEAGILLERETPEKRELIGAFLGNEDLRKAGILHDIGKVRIPPAILYKPGKLSEEEFRVMKLHPVLGEEMVRPIAVLRHLCPTIRGHHERWDGRGYPDGLAGEAIPLPARVIAVADVFDALSAARPYKDAMPMEKVMEIMREGRGSHFDPQLLDAFVKVMARSSRPDKTMRTPAEVSVVMPAQR